MILAVALAVTANAAERASSNGTGVTEKWLRVVGAMSDWALAEVTHRNVAIAKAQRAPTIPNERVVCFIHPSFEDMYGDMLFIASPQRFDYRQHRNYTLPS